MPCSRRARACWYAVYAARASSYARSRSAVRFCAATAVATVSNAMASNRFMNTFPVEFFDMAQPRFVHLRMHSEYSVSDGIVRIDDAVDRAGADHMPALALTDSAYLYGTVKFYGAARRAGCWPPAGRERRTDRTRHQRAFPRPLLHRAAARRPAERRSAALALGGACRSAAPAGGGNAPGAVSRRR